MLAIDPSPLPEFAPPRAPTSEHPDCRMPTPFSSQDLGRIFDGRTLTRGRSLGLAGGVAVQLEDDTITGTVQERSAQHRVRITPSRLGRRIVFDHHCSCGVRACAHIAAAAFAALDRFPELRRPEQQTFFDTLVEAPAPEAEKQRAVFELAPGEAPYACSVTTLLIGERSGTAIPTTPTAIEADMLAGPATREAARCLGGSRTRTGVAGRAGGRTAARAGAQQPGALARRRQAAELRRDALRRLRGGGGAAATVRRDRWFRRPLVRGRRHRRGRAHPHPPADCPAAARPATAARTTAADRTVLHASR